MKYKMKLANSPFEMIKNGKKTIELRLFDEKRQKLNIGDVIEFSKLPDLKEKVEVKITGLLRYEKFIDLFNDFGVEYYGYEKEVTISDFIPKMYNIYTKEQEEKYGVLGIKIKIKT